MPAVMSSPGGGRRPSQIAQWRLPGKSSVLLRAAIAAAALLGAPSAYSADTTESAWNGSSSTSWGNSTNWGANGIPSSTVSAEFVGAFANQPGLTGASTS